jgi:hypothetical protein
MIPRVILSIHVPTQAFVCLTIFRFRYARQIKQLQEREAFLEGNCQQLEKDIRRLEEQLVAVQSESESKAQEAAEAKMAGLRQKVDNALFLPCVRYKSSEF